MAFENLLANVEVRRHNGQCDFGCWYKAGDEDVPAWVGEWVADEIAENDADEGMVEQGGSKWAWRKVSSECVPE